jgi:ATP-dependent Lon protease
MKCVILPEENRSKFEDLDETVKSDLEVHFVKNYREVLDIAFPRERYNLDDSLQTQCPH